MTYVRGARLLSCSTIGDLIEPLLNSISDSLGSCEQSDLGVDLDESSFADSF